MKKVARRRDPGPPSTRATRAELDRFEAWLREQGLAKTTAEMYAQDARSATEYGFKARVLDDQLAPKTRHRILSAGRQWAEFRSDVELAASLKKVNLPPAHRKLPKVPVERDELFAIVDELERASDYLDAPARAVIGMMACRGFRVSDVLRIQREELSRAKETGLLVFPGKGNRRLEFGLIKTWARHAISLADAPGEWSRVEDLICPDAGNDTRRKSAVRSIERSLAKVAARAGVTKVYPHRLRRTYAIQYLRQHTGDPEALMKLKQHMQWADESTALQYVNHLRGRELDEAAERIFER
jgi:site-specific recombinase XerC